MHLKMPRMRLSLKQSFVLPLGQTVNQWILINKLRKLRVYVALRHSTVQHALWTRLKRAPIFKRNKMLLQLKCKDLPAAKLSSLHLLGRNHPLEPNLRPERNRQEANSKPLVLAEVEEGQVEGRQAAAEVEEVRSRRWDRF
jgi:hypothetical protein